MYIIYYIISFMSDTQRQLLFPHITRIITEFRAVRKKIIKEAVLAGLRSALKFVLPVLLVAGLLVLGILNIVEQRKYPAALKRALQNPQDQALLVKIYEQAGNAEFRNWLRIRLSGLPNGEQILADLDHRRALTEEKKVGLAEALGKSPEYPDGYASLAILHLSSRSCGEATAMINKAMELDPNRAVFQEIKDLVAECH